MIQSRPRGAKDPGAGGLIDDVTDDVSDTPTYLFSGYARLPKDVSHQEVHSRVGVVVEVDGEGRIVAADCTLLMGLARDFFARTVVGLSVLTQRDEIEAAVRERYLGHSQGALLFALHKVFEAVDLSPLAGAV